MTNTYFLLVFSVPEETKHNWRKTKIVKNVISDPLPVLQLAQSTNGLQPPTGSSPQSSSVPSIPESDEEPSGKQRRKVLQLLGEPASAIDMYILFLILLFFGV